MELDTETPQGERRARTSHTPTTAWLTVLAVSLGLAVVSWLSKISTAAQLAGDSDGWLTLRYVVRELSNSGTAWAGLGILCGWLLRLPFRAAVAGLAGTLFSLLAHYFLGQLFGTFDSTIWAEKSYWFIAALILGAPLGLVGASFHRNDGWGLPARLVVPVGAILEPFALGLFRGSDQWSVPLQNASFIAGVTLVVAGVAGCATILRAVITRRRRHPGASRAGGQR